MKFVLVVFAFALLAALLLTTAVAAADLPTGTPEEPEPPGWDKSSLVVSGFCDADVPTYEVLNGGADMSGPTDYYLFNTDGGSSTCEENLLQLTPLVTGTLQLSASQGITLTFPGLQAVAPLKLCVAQRLGHPGIGWAAENISEACVPPTAIEEGEEPTPHARFLFLPVVKS